MKTAVTSALDSLGVSYTLKPHASPALTAETAASERGVRISQIVKCMVATTGDAYIVMMIPGHRRLKSSKARKHVGAERLELVPAQELRDDLGLTVGAIAPYQLLGRARMLMDPVVLEEEVVDISSGDPLAGVELKSADLQTSLEAEVIPIVSANA